MEAETSRPRVLWVHQNFVARGQVGNERPAWTVAAFLEQGWSVDLVTGTGSYLGGHRYSPGTEIDGALRWHRVVSDDDGTANRRANYLRFIRRIRATLRRLPRPDLVFASTPPLPQIAIALQQATRHKAALVLEVRDLWPAFLAEAGLVRGRVTLGGLSWLEATCYRGADAVISASPAFRPYLEGMAVEPGRILTAPHGAADRDIESLQAAGAAWRASRGLQDCVVLLYAGSLHEHYGVQTLLASAASTCDEARPLRWVIAGDGRCRRQVEEAAHRLPNLDYVGPLPRRELDTVLGAADASIVSLRALPLFSTVLPGKLIDSLSCGLPVICTAPGQTARIVDSADAGWTCPDDPDALTRVARAVSMLSVAERRSKGENGRRWVRSHMAAEAQGRAIAALCAEVVREPRPRARPRMLRALLLGLRDATTGRSERLLDRLFRDGRDASAQRAFETWASAGTRPADSRPLEIPALLR